MGDVVRFGEAARGAVNAAREAAAQPAPRNDEQYLRDRRELLRRQAREMRREKLQAAGGIQPVTYRELTDRCAEGRN